MGMVNEMGKFIPELAECNEPLLQLLHIKRRERELRKSKMEESVSTNKQRDIWVETKKMISGKKPSINSVDGACNPEAISEVFASKYETLFQGRAPTDPVELQSLYRTIKSGVAADEQSYSSVNVNDVLDALKDIKLGKHDGKYSLTSDHVVNSSRRFLVIIVDPNVEHACSRIQCRLFIVIHYYFNSERCSRRHESKRQLQRNSAV